jgi:hypothetical protein
VTQCTQNFTSEEWQQMGGAGHTYVNQQHSKRNNNGGRGGSCGSNGGRGHGAGAVVEMAMMNVRLDLSRAMSQMELAEVTIPA